MKDAAAALRNTTGFSGLPDSVLVDLTHLGRTVQFSPGSRLMTQGEPARELFLLLSGHVTVERNHSSLGMPLRLADLGPGEVVGEMGVLDGEPRSATVTAVDEVEAFMLSASALAVVILESPSLAVHLLHTVSRRLRSTDALAEAMLSGSIN